MYSTTEENNENMCNDIKNIVKETTIKPKMTYALTVANKLVMLDLAKKCPLNNKTK